MRFKTETKNRIQALKYRDGLENHQIAKEMGISQNMIWQYIQGLEKQIEKGEITVADIVKSVNTLKIEGPKKKWKKDEDKIVFDEASSMTEKQVDEMIAEQGMTQKEISENVQALDDAVAKAGEPNMEDIRFDEIGATQYQLSEGFQALASGGIVKPTNGHEPDGGKEMQIPIRNPSKQSDYILSIMAHIYDELVAGKVALRYYLMEDGVHELQFVEVKKK